MQEVASWAAQVLLAGRVFETAGLDITYEVRIQKKGGLKVSFLGKHHCNIYGFNINLIRVHNTLN